MGNVAGYKEGIKVDITGYVYTVIYIIDDTIQKVIPCGGYQVAKIEHDKLLVKHGYCVEDLDESIQGHQEDGTTLVEVGGKHWYVGDNENLTVWVEKLRF